MKPQWGRSLSQNLPAQAQVTQVVRVQLAKPADVTLYLGGQEIANTSVTWLTYRVSIGNGGISLVHGRTIAPARGIARHFVADVVEVDAEMRAASGTGQTRVFGCLSLGRAFEIVEPGIQITTLGPLDPIPAPGFDAIQNTGWTTVGGAGHNRRLFKAPQWSTQMRIAVNNPSGVPATQVVEEYSAGGALLAARTADKYVEFEDLDPQTWFVLLSATGVDNWDALLTFKRVT